MSDDRSKMLETLIKKSKPKQNSVINSYWVEIIEQIAGLGRRKAPVTYAAGFNVSLTTKSRKSSLWVETKYSSSSC